MPESRGDVDKTASGCPHAELRAFRGSLVRSQETIQPLVGPRVVQRTSFRNVRADFDVVEKLPERSVHLAASAVQRRDQPQTADMRCEFKEAVRVPPLSEEKETVYAEVPGLHIP